jgi:formate dehydrogenase major subunit
MYKAAEKPVIVFEQNALTEAAGALLANIANTQAGIIQLKPNANSQGLADLNLGYADDLMEKIKNRTVKALISFSEDANEIVDISGLEFLCVGDVYLTETAKKAEVVLPCASFAESEGTYTNTVGQVHELKRALKPIAGYTNAEIIQSLINTVDTSIKTDEKLRNTVLVNDKTGAIQDDGNMFTENKNANALFNRISITLKSLNT